MAKKPEQSEAEKLIAHTISAFKTSLNSPAGKIMMTDLEKSFYFRSCFDPNPIIMAKLEGSREVVQRMRNLRDADPHNVRIEVKT